MVVSFGFLGRAMTAIPLGTAHAIGIRIGAVGTALVGMACLGEPRPAARLARLGLVVTGIVVLKLCNERA